MPTIYKNGKNYSGGTTVDPALSSISSNPVQNKVVKQALDELILNFANYYNKTEVDSIVNAIKNSRFEAVATLPTTDIKTNVIYLVPKSSAQTNNVKDEYINLDGTSSGWEKIGDTEIDLSGYVTINALNTALSNYTTTTDLTALLNNKVDKVTGKGLSTNDYTDAEKQKLANIESNAQVNVQSDWNEDDTEDDGYIKNKPDLSTSLTATGNPITIESAESNLVECVAEVEAVQDLHGYDKPWVGGAGKNLAPTYAEPKAYYGITITPQSDGSVILNGTKTSNANFPVTDVIALKSGKTYTVSIGTLPQGINDYGISGYSSQKTVTPQSDYNSNGVQVMVNEGTTLNNVRIYPQVELGNTATSYEPYSNISPITGQTEVVIEDVGKNLWGGEKLLNDFMATGIVSHDSTNRTISYLASQIVDKTIVSDIFKENTQYTIILNGKSSTSNTTNLTVIYEDGTSNKITSTFNTSTFTNSIYITAKNKTVKQIVGSWVAGTTTLKYDECGIFEGVLTVDDFESYKGKTYRVEIGQKNKLPMTVEGIKSVNTGGTWSGNVYTVSGGTIEILTDLDNNVIGFKVNGTFNATVWFVTAPAFTLDANTYIISGASNNVGLYGEGSTAFADWNSTNATPETQKTFTSDATGRIYLRASATQYSNEIVYPMIRTTIDDSEFAPYNPNLPEAIYGGELDVLTGGLRVTHGEVDLGTLSWIYQSQYRRFYTSYSPAKPIDNQQIANAICSQYVVTDADSTHSPHKDKVIAISQSKNIIIFDTDYSDSTTFKNAMSGVQLVYELAEPYTIQLTPQQIRLLKGMNHISCNTGDLSIKYYPDNVLGQLKGDIENEIKTVDNKIKNIKTMKFTDKQTTDSGQLLFPELENTVIISADVYEGTYGKMAIPYIVGNIPRLKVVEVNDLSTVSYKNISGTVYYYEI